MPFTCQLCDQPIEDENKATYLEPRYLSANNIQTQTLAMGQSMLKAHYQCIRDPENLGRDQQAAWALLTAVKNKADLDAMKKDVARIEDALLQCTDPALAQFQDQIQHIRETYNAPRSEGNGR